MRRASYLYRTATALFALACCITAQAEDERGPHEKPVAEIGDQRLMVSTPKGQGALVLYASRPAGGDAVEADIERAVLVFHGRLRDAGTYWRSAQKAAAAAPAVSRHSLLIVPQFLAERDVAAHDLAPNTLRWSLDGWMGGEDSLGPVPISSFEAIDAILATLADRKRFPHLTQVVVAGHSGGGQVVQRYAVVGQGDARLAAAGIKTRYVVANPSSYLYFNADRPAGNGHFAPPRAALCPGFNDWKYGWTGAPAYAQRLAPAAYEQRYAARDVVYLLGEEDVDAMHPALDRSCAAEAQGPYRLARGHEYVAYLRQRHPALTQRLHDIPHVGHDGGRMLGSACGLSTLFDDPASRAACEARGGASH